MGGGGSRRGLRRGRAQGPARRSREKGRSGRRRRLAGAPGRGTLEKDKPPILGLIQRGGQLVIRMLANVQQKTIQPVITATVTPDSLIHTDEYDIYARLPTWGYRHKTVCHSRGEYARDEDGDGFCEVHVNTMEGVWSLLRSWLRPHRGISQEKLPIYLGFFEFVQRAPARKSPARCPYRCSGQVMRSITPEADKSHSGYPGRGRPAHGDASGPLFSGGRRHAEFHPRGGTVPCLAAGADPRDPAARRGAWRPVAAPRAQADPPDRFRQADRTASAPDADRCRGRQIDRQEIL